MRKIMKLLAAVVLSASLISNILACSGKPTPSEEPNQGNDVNALLKAVTNKIETWFGDLNSKNKNILRPNNFPDETGEPLLEDITKLKAETVLTNDQATPFYTFYDVINENISNFDSKLNNDKQVKLLFNNIDVNKIITLNRTSATKITKSKFEEWKNNGAFDLDDYTPEKYQITALNKLNCSLTLDLNWRNFDGKELIYPIVINHKWQ